MHFHDVIRWTPYPSVGPQNTAYITGNCSRSHIIYWLINTAELLKIIYLLPLFSKKYIKIKYINKTKADKNAISLCDITLK